jgi:hypothetical protein
MNDIPLELYLLRPMSLQTKLKYEITLEKQFVLVDLVIENIEIVMKKTQLANMVRLIEFSYEYSNMQDQYQLD